MIEKQTRLVSFNEINDGVNIYVHITVRISEGFDILRETGLFGYPN